MRELKPETAKIFRHLSPPVYSKEPEIFSDGSEKSYSSSNGNGTNAQIIIIVMFSFVVSIPLLVLAIRCFLCGRGETDRNRISQDTEQEKIGIGTPASLLLLAPTFKYSGDLELAGSERECMICLSEFVDGEEVKVLTRCKHGFHVRCIDQWFSSHLSCPLCRSRVRFSSMVERGEDYGNRASNSQAAARPS